MTRGNQTLTYTLTAKTAGQAGLARFNQELERLLEIQERIKAQGGVLTILQAQVAPAVQAAERQASAQRKAYNENQEALRQLTLEHARMRAEFDREAGQTTTWQKRLQLIGQYEQGIAKLREGLAQYGQRADLTTQQLIQLERIQARLSREQATANGNVNILGLSGNVMNGIDNSRLNNLLGVAGTLSPSLGAMAMNGQQAIEAFTGLRAAAGPMGVALGVVGVAAVGVVAGIGSAVSASADLEKALNGLKASSGANSDQLKELKGSAQNTAATYGVMTTQVVEAQEELSKAGVKLRDIAGGASEAVTVLAKATGVGIKDAVDIAVPAMNIWGLSGAQMMHIADVVSNGANKSALDVAGMAMSMQQAAGSAQAADLSFEQTTAVLAMLADRGMQGSDAGTSLRTMMERLRAPTDDATTALGKAGLAIFDSTGKQRDMITVLGEVISAMDKMTDQQRAAFAQTVFGTDAQRSITAAWRAGTGTLAEYIAAMGQSGTAEENAKTRTEGLRGAQDKLNAAFDIFKTKVGDVFTPAITDLVTAATSGVNTLSKLFDWLEKLDGKSQEVAQTAMQKQLEQVRGELSAARSELNTMLKTEAIQVKSGSGTTPQFDQRIADQRAKVAQLESQIKALEVQTRTEAQQNGTFVGPVASGVNQDAPSVALSVQTTDALGRQVVAAATAGKLGDLSADSIVDYCAKWVRLTLDKASPEASTQINKLFQTDSNGDGQVTAGDAARNMLKAGFAQRYSGTADLKPGDIIFYTENGQNHTGVYIGDGVVRGNNRVTYAANGGKFDAYGNPTTPGINPVGDVNINKLGTPNWVVRPGDMLPTMGVKPKAAPNTAPGAPDGADDDTPISAAQIAKAQALTAALEKATKAHDPKAIDAATLALKKWSDHTDSNARAVAAVQKAQSGLNKSAGEYIATQADLRKYGDDALRLIKRQEEAQKSGSASQIASAKQALDAWQGESKAKAAVIQVEQAAYQSRQQARTKGEADDKKAQQEAARVNEAIRQGDIESARAGVARLEGLRDAALTKVKGNEAEELRVTREHAGLIYAAKKAVLDQEKKDRDADIRNSSDPNKRQQLATSQSTYDTGLKAALGAKNAAITAAEEALDKEQDRRTRERNAKAAQAAEAARQGRVADARLALADLEAYREQDLKTAGDNLQMRLNVEKTYAALIRDAKRKIAAAEYADAKRDAENRNNAETEADIKRAERARNQASRAAGREATNRPAEAQEALSQKVSGLRDEYRKLADGIREQVQAGEFDAEAKQKALAQFNALGKAAREAGIYENEYGVAARRSAYATIQQWEAGALLVKSSTERIAQIKAQADAEQDAADDAAITLPSLSAMLGELVGQGLDPRETGFVKLLDELIAKGGKAAEAARYVKDNLDGLEADLGGNSLPAIAERGRRALQAARDANNAEVPEGTTLAESAANTLTGRVLDEVFNQPKTAADKLKTALGTAMSASFSDLGEAGREEFWGRFSDLVDDPELDSLSLDLAATIVSGLNDDEQWAPLKKRLTGILAEAERVQEVLNGELANPTRDTFNRTADAAPTPTNRFDELNQTLLEMGTVTDAGTLAGLNEGLELARKNGELTADELVILKGVVDGLSTDPLADMIKGYDELGNAIYKTDKDLRNESASTQGTTEDFYDLAEALKNVGRFSESELEALIEKTGLGADEAEKLRAAWKDVNFELRRAKLEGRQASAESSGNPFELWGASREREALAKDEAQAAFDREVKGLEEGAPAYQLAQQKLENARNAAAREGARERLTIVQGEAQKVGQIAQGLYSMFGEEQLAQGVGQLTDAVTGGIEAFGKFASGDILGGTLAVVGVLGNLGKAIDNLNPAITRMKKEWTELAQAEQQAMGQRMVGGSFGQNGLLNPFYDALKKDSEALTTKANAGFWQRLGWSLFGNAPQTLDRAASESLQKMSAVFNDFGQSLYSTMENELMNAIDQGDFSKASGNVGQMLDRFTNKLFIQALIAKSRLGDLAKQLAEDVAAGRDTSSTEAQIRAETDRVIGQAESAAPSRPSYGAGAQTDAPASSPAGDPVQGANFYVANSSKIDLFDNVIERADAMYLRHEGVLTLHASAMTGHTAALTEHTTMLRRVLADGISLTDSQGNYRGAMR